MKYLRRDATFNDRGVDKMVEVGKILGRLFAKEKDPHAVFELEHIIIHEAGYQGTMRRHGMSPKRS